MKLVAMVGARTGCLRSFTAIVRDGGDLRVVFAKQSTGKEIEWYFKEADETIVNYVLDNVETKN